MPNNRSDSTTRQVENVANASKLHGWPDEAGTPNARDVELFNRMQQQRSHTDWTPFDLISAANLAKLQADLVEQHDLLRAEGVISYGGKTGLVPIQNPRVRIVSDLNGQVNSLARRLGFTSASLPDRKKRANNAAAAREARKYIDQPTHEGNRPRRRSLICWANDDAHPNVKGSPPVKPLSLNHIDPNACANLWSEAIRQHVKAAIRGDESSKIWLSRDGLLVASMLGADVEAYWHAVEHIALS